MNLEEAAALLGPNLILPEALIASPLTAEFSQNYLERLKEIPLQESDLQSLDFYKGKTELSLGKTVNDNWILYPMPERNNVFELMRRFGFVRNEKTKLFFINNSEKGDSLAGWREWFFNERACADHPVYRAPELGWRLLRREPIAGTFGKNLEAGQRLLIRGDAVPTLLEILTAIVAYYFSVVDPRKSDKEVGMPIFSSRDLHGRLLSGKMAWTSDIFAAKNNPGENLIVGFNLPSLGIDIYKLNAAKASEVVGIMPLRRLRFN